MNHDPDVFDEPDKFMPERWLKDDSGEAKDDLRLWTFGFGRRYVFVYDSYILVALLTPNSACPGQRLAENTLLISISTILWALTISPAIDPVTAEELKIDSERESGFAPVGIL